MTLEINYTTKCNLQCTYCYQNPMRDAGNFGAPFDVDKVINALEKESTEFVMFGGEALLAPLQTLEVLWSYGYDRFKKNGVQTNGALITEAHIALFKKYNVHVGVSIDGPGELNNARKSSFTENSTKKTEENLVLLSVNKIPRSLIVTLTKINGDKKVRNTFKDWFQTLKDLDYKHIRLHLLENHDSDNIALNDSELIELLEDLESMEGFEFDLFKEIKDRIAGNEKAGSCVFHGCDPYTTPAVQAIGGDGSKYNCGRVNKNGIDYIKASTHSNDRDLVLYTTPQEHGGCKDCRFFVVCRGYCPGTSIDNDWRNRTVFCKVLMHFYEKYERQCLDKKVVPISLTNKRFISVKVENVNHADVPHGDRVMLKVPILRETENSMGDIRSEESLGENILTGGASN